MKTKNEKFLKIYNSLWTTSYGKNRWSAVVWTQAFSNGGNKLPANTEILDAVLINDVTAIHVWLEPIGPKARLRRNKHRAFVMCDKCDHRVPAGRIHQHKC